MITNTAALALLVLAAPLQQTDTTFAVPVGARLDMQSTGGTIVIDTWDQQRVRIQARHGVRDEVRIRTNGSVVRVETDSRGAAIVDYRVTVPATMDLELGGLYTDISIAGSRGRIDANTVQGEIIVDGGRDQITLRSVNGRVVLSGAIGSADVVAVSGGVRLENVSGDIQVQTVSGPLVLMDVDSNNVEASSVSGALHYDGVVTPDGRYTFTTHSGHITVAVAPNLNAAVTVAVVSGSFSSTLDGIVADTNVRGRRQTFTAGGGAAVLEMESFSGSIRLIGRGEGSPPRVGRPVDRLEMVYHFDH